MNITDILDCYEYVKEDLKFQGISSVRIKIMIGLSEGPKKTKDLRELIRIPASTILHGINELEKQKLISRKGDDFFLSEVGMISTLKLVEMIKTRILLKNTAKLWLDHDIKSIPENLLVKIGELSSSQLANIEKPEYMLKTSSKEVKSVFPLFYPECMETFRELLKNDASINMILTEDVLKKTVESLNPAYLTDFKKSLSKKLKIWEIKEEPKVAFTVTDKSMKLGLFTLDGTYDPHTILVSHCQDSVKWGDKLFDHYLKKSYRVDMEYFK